MKLGLAGGGGAVSRRLRGRVGGLFSGCGEDGGGGVEARGGGGREEGNAGPWPRERESRHYEELGGMLARGVVEQLGRLRTVDSVAGGAGAGGRGGERRATSKITLTKVNVRLGCPNNQNQFTKHARDPAIAGTWDD